MDDFRRTPSGAGTRPRRPAPPPALCGFLLLLALVFAVSYAVGAAAGPVAPGMHGTGTGRDGGDGDGGADGTDGMDGMGSPHGGGR
ncbi:hypothetical protein [Streptomyces capoamus]|uniref:hypothetical protein n=1 Tax=Streptomyces capoamus TaxID=68183 RepID=UPI0033946C0E